MQAAPSHIVAAYPMHTELFENPSVDQLASRRCICPYRTVSRSYPSSNNGTVQEVELSLPITTSVGVSIYQSRNFIEKVIECSYDGTLR